MKCSHTEGCLHCIPQGAKVCTTEMALKTLPGFISLEDHTIRNVR